jgi:hypothetical protein
VGEGIGDVHYENEYQPSSETADDKAGLPRNISHVLDAPPSTSGAPQPKATGDAVAEGTAASTAASAVGDASSAVSEPTHRVIRFQTTFLTHLAVLQSRIAAFP